MASPRSATVKATALSCGVQPLVFAAIHFLNVRLLVPLLLAVYIGAVELSVASFSRRLPNLEQFSLY